MRRWNWTIGTLAAVACGVLLVTGNVFAGNTISVELSDDGVLTILGDRESNMAFLAVRDGFVGAEVTTSSDRASMDVPIEEVRCINFQLGDGNDDFRFWCHDVLTADVNVDGGRGDDQISCYGDLRDPDQRNPDARIDGSFCVNTGAGVDNMGVVGLVVSGTVRVSTGHGRDSVVFSAWNYYDSNEERWAAISCEIGGGALINTGLNDDLVFFKAAGNSEDVLALAVTGDLEVECGQGDDLIDCSNGHSIVVVGGTALLSGGQGEDYHDEGIIADETIIIGFED